MSTTNTPEKETRPNEAQQRPPRTSPPNHIYVGKKPVMSYAMSALIQLAQMGEVVIKARGMAISRAADVAQITTKRLGADSYEIKKINIDTERVGEGEEARNVSTMEIIIGKKVREA
jgi:DNA-binding protein